MSPTPASDKTPANDQAPTNDRVAAEEPEGLISRLSINPPVFFGSAAMILAFVLWAALFPEAAETTFQAVQNWITETFGWFYMVAVAIFVIFAVSLALSPYGEIRLGADDARPEFGYLAWFAMLFSAGMGIGLMFYGVAEPIWHYASPAVGDGHTLDAAREAMKTSFFHWGLHAWAIYAVVALSLAYFGFRMGLPLTIRSALYPIIGNRMYGPIGSAVDTFAVIGTMFGVATSLGLGVMQVNSGLTYLFDVPDSVLTQIVLIAVISALATVSVVSGLDKGIRRISELNLILALLLVGFVLAMGPTLFLLRASVQNIGAYLGDVVDKTFMLYAYSRNDWISGWTLFYWAWWIAWSPFVGMFIARVSHGRTIREFVTGVLGVPVLFTFIWLTVFGNTAISLEMGQAAGAISAAVNENISTALFHFFEYLPLPAIVSFVATTLVVTFFVTSSDSGSLVICILTSGGVSNPPVWQRLFWGVTVGLVAAALLLSGGLSALQTASITAALPFVFTMLVVCYGLLKGLRAEGVQRVAMDMPAPTQIRGAQVPWRQRLHSLVRRPDEAEVVAFLTDTVRPALQDVAAELRTQGMTAGLENQTGCDVALTVYHGRIREFRYDVRVKAYTAPDFAKSHVGHIDPNDLTHHYRAEVQLLEGEQHYDIMGWSEEQVIADVLSQYQKHIDAYQLFQPVAA
jgi:choline/glycine/proline betaine transport protein